MNRKIFLTALSLACLFLCCKGLPAMAEDVPAPPAASATAPGDDVQALEKVLPDLANPEVLPEALTAAYTYYYQGKISSADLQQLEAAYKEIPPMPKTTSRIGQVSAAELAAYKEAYAKQEGGLVATGGQVTLNGTTLSPRLQAAGIGLYGDTAMIGEWLLPHLNFTVTHDNLRLKVTSVTGSASEWTLGSTAYAMNGSIARAAAAPYLKGPYFYLPLRALAETVGTVNWDSETRDISVITPSKTLTPPPAFKESTTTPPLETSMEQKPNVINRLPDGSLLTADGVMDSGGYRIVCHKGVPLLRGLNDKGVLFNQGLVPTADRIVWLQSMDPASPGAMPFGLYEAPLADASQAKLIAENIYPDIDSLVANDRWIVYTAPLSKPGKGVALTAYNRLTGQKQLIDQGSGDQDYLGDLALNGNTLVWSRSRDGWNESLQVCDLTAPGKAKDISQGYAFTKPVISSKYVIASRVFRTIRGQTEEIWQYDLEKGQWTRRIDPASSLMPQNDDFFIKKAAFGDHYVALCPVLLKSDTRDFTRLSVLDLRDGSLAPLTLNEGNLPLIHADRDLDGSRLIDDIAPAADGSLLLKTYTDGGSDSIFMQAK